MLLAFAFIYLVGRTFYKLAEKYEKNKWLFAVLGVLSYYAGILIASFVLGVILALTNPEMLDTLSDNTATIIAIPVGALSCWGLYAFLKKSWREASTKVDHGALDSGFITETREEKPGDSGQKFRL